MDQLLVTSLSDQLLTYTGTHSSEWWQFCNDDSGTNNQSNTRAPGAGSCKDNSSQRTHTKPTTTASACDQCYRFKVKCTREADCCQRCRTNGNPCTYSTTISTERLKKRQSPEVPSIPQVKKVTFESSVERNHALQRKKYSSPQESSSLIIYSALGLFGYNSDRSE